MVTHPVFFTGESHESGAWPATVRKVKDLDTTEVTQHAHTRFVIAFLPKSKCLLISWLQSPSAVILGPSKIKSLTVSIDSPPICKFYITSRKQILQNVNNSFLVDDVPHFHQLQTTISSVLKEPPVHCLLTLLLGWERLLGERFVLCVEAHNLCYQCDVYSDWGVRSFCFFFNYQVADSFCCFSFINK